MDGTAAAIYRYCWLTFLWLSSAVNSIKFCLILLTRNAIIFQRELSRRGVADDAHRMQSVVENRFDNQSENEILIENNIFELNWNKTVTEYMQQNELFLSGIWVTEEKYYIAEWVFHILFNIIFFSCIQMMISACIFDMIYFWHFNTLHRCVCGRSKLSIAKYRK